MVTSLAPRVPAPTLPLASPPAPQPEPTAQTLYDHFLQGEAEATPDHLAYQDRGIDLSPLKDQIPAFPSRLIHSQPAPGQGTAAYPAIGVLPGIDETKLDFLDPSITNACVCVGSWEQGGLHASWSGRQATSPVQMWSSTKLIPMTRVAARANQASPDSSLENCQVRDPNGTRSISLPAAFDAIVSYRQGDSMSNQLAKMFKQFDTPEGLEGWVHHTTGNNQVVFRGGYGEAPYIDQPVLTDTSTHQNILKAAGAEHHGDNLVSPYDLCRYLFLIGWHSHLSAPAQLPEIRQAGVDTLVRGLGTDSARFVDVALEALGMQDRVQDPVVISKLGYGLSDERQQFEEVYSAYVQFTDKETHRPYELALSLRGAAKPDAPDAPLKLDARMATQVALIMQKVIKGDLV